MSYDGNTPPTKPPSLFQFNAEAALPNNTDAETSVLGAIIVNNDLIHTLSARLTAEDFYEPVHGQIWTRCQELIAEGRKASFVALLPEFRGKKVGVMDLETYLSSIVDVAATNPDELAGYVREILHYSAERDLLYTARDLGNLVANGKANLSTVSAEFAARLEGASAKARESEITGKMAGDAAREALRIAREGGASGHPTGMKDLDNMTGGLLPGEVSVIGGRSSQGKSTVALQIALNVAKAGGGVFYWSGEMSATAMGQRMLTSLSYTTPEQAIHYSALRLGTLSQDKFERLVHAQTGAERLPLFVEEQSGLTTLQISARARKFRNDLKDAAKNGAPEADLKLIVVDYLGLMQSSNRYKGNRAYEVGEISQALKALSKELNVHVMVVHQVNRGVEGRDDKRPLMSDLRDSGQIEQDADLIIMAFREHYYLQRQNTDNDIEADVDKRAAMRRTENVIELIVAKQRMGQTGTVTAFCDMGANYIADLQVTP